MEFELKHPKTFRYEILAGAEDADTVIYALHGYGQLARFFIRKFSMLSDRFIIVAPEGMHRFYLRGSSGRVGASWMTKEARESDIQDNISWLNALDKEISEKYQIKKRILLGFSQGGATAARWESLGNVSFDEMILWACVFPPDLDKNKSSKHVNTPWFVIGNEDEFYDQEAQEALILYYEELGYQIKKYIGKHDIDQETLLEITRPMN